MSELSVPLSAPDPGDDNKNAGRSEPPRGRTRKPRSSERPPPPPVPTTDDCLQMLAHLPRLVALGILTPAQSNSMAASYREILRHHQRAETSQASRGVAELDVLGIHSRDPDVINMLAPFLTEAQLEKLLARSQEDSDE